MRLLQIFLFCLPLCSKTFKVTQTCQGYDCLKNYVAKVDYAYKWEDIGKRIEVPDYEGSGGWTGYVLNFTSQTWLSPSEG